MGEVYKAEDTKLGRRVALKILPTAMAANHERLERFQREAKVVASLNHPNIVTIHSVEEADGVHFLTMELVEGHDLERCCRPTAFRSPRSSTSRCRSPMPWRRRTSRASSTATSSPPTSC